MTWKNLSIMLYVQSCERLTERNLACLLSRTGLVLLRFGLSLPRKMRGLSDAARR
jgi:hypothetical protein